RRRRVQRDGRPRPRRAGGRPRRHLHIDHHPVAVRVSHPMGGTGLCPPRPSVRRFPMRSISIAAALAAASFIALSGASPAAATAEDESITWSVRPGDDAGEDGRAWVEWDADPGESITEHMVVTNHGSTDVEFQLSA